MAPLILHNVPDEELYVGDDGIQRPYAMVFPHQEGHPASTRSRRAVAESGSFGKSTRRARSRTGTPARRDNPTLAAADKVFSEWISNQAVAPSNTATTPNRKSSGGAAAGASTGALDEAQPAQGRLAVKAEPTEVILRGYKNAGQQYAAVNHYEQLAGRICEDYPRLAPLDQRRYKSGLSDPAFIRHMPLSPEERVMVNRAAGGDHWVKVTFESTDAAEAAYYASPQNVLGHVVYAEPYHGHPPVRDEAIPDMEGVADHHRSRSVPTGTQHPPPTRRDKRAASAYADPFADHSPPESGASSHTLDTTAFSNALSNTLSSTTVTGAEPAATTSSDAVAIPAEDSIYCRKIPTARRARILPAEQALLPQQTVMQRFTNAIPFLKWFSGSMIGNEVPRTELGEFDWNRASLYWKIMWWIDLLFGLFGKDLVSADKDD